MSQLLDSIHKGLALACAKGCPVESIWVSPQTHDDLSTVNARAPYKVLDGYHVSIVRMTEPYQIKLECGWTDRHGKERTDITALDVVVEFQAPPAIDTASMEEHPLWASFG